MKEADYEEAPQQYAPRPKQVRFCFKTLTISFIYEIFFPQAPKAPRPQSFNYAPAPVEQRKPVYPTPAPQYYEYEEETQTTQRPIQIARQKYAAQAQQPQQPRPQQPQYQNEFEFLYSPEQRAANAAPQHQQFENRQPVQFPTETEALFSPASRADSYKPKVRIRKKLLRRIKKRRNRSKRRIYFVIRKRKYL